MMPMSHSGRDVPWTLRQRNDLSWRQRFWLLFTLAKVTQTELLLSINLSGLLNNFSIISSTFW